MTITVVPTEDDMIFVLGTFLTSVLPAGVEIVRAQVNRVPQPKSSDFVMMTPIYRERLATNIDDTADCAFEATISGPSMIVSAVDIGLLTIGNEIFGLGILSNTTIVSQQSGMSGGAGSYTIKPNQSVPTTQTLACGAKVVLQETKVSVQLDVHGPNSADNAQIISTLFRDAFAVDAFTDQNLNITPLYTDEGKQIPFINDQNQYENRWVIEAWMQVNATVVVPQQYAGSIIVVPKPVDAYCPP